MESAQAPLGLIATEWPTRTVYIIHSEVVNIEEQKVPCYVSGIGAGATFIEKSLGWFVYLKGSHEALHLGMDKPTLAKGDKVKITVEKI